MDNKQVAEKIYKNLISGKAFEQVDNDYMEHIFKNGNIILDSTMDKLVKDIILYSVAITREYENMEPPDNSDQFFSDDFQALIKKQWAN
jgi:hypothetical protein